MANNKKSDRSVIVATEANNGQTYPLVAGDTVRIELSEGGFVGYYWEVVEAPDSAVIQFDDQGATYTGDLGTHVWTARAVNTGTTRLVLRRQPDGLLYTLTFQVS